MANRQLHTAKAAKKDEFYTRIEDINAELIHYEDKFKDKVVLCNCDDPAWSNFWRYFHMNFEYLGLKKLISTHYEAGNVQTYKMEYMGGNDLDFEDGIITPLQQNGDFRSPECIELLKEADIVVTNPPFSLWRCYISQLIEHDKQFLVIGNVNALTYKEVFPLVRDNKLWLGASIHSGDRKFYVPDRYPLNAAGCGVDEDGKRFIRVKGVRWFTNIDYPARHINLETPYLFAKRDELYPDLYPKYDNYDAINVDKVAEIPMDYDGVMGVPITFLDKYNPDQFEIVAFRKGEDGKDLVFTREREFNRNFVSLYDVDTRDDKECGRRDKWAEYLRQNNDQAKIEPIDFFFPNATNLANTLVNDCTINGKKTYVRMLVRRKAG